jgi:membrane-associated phospholipid phosphatase
VFAVDKRWYRDVNRLARRTSWAHGTVTAYVERALAPVGAGLLLLVALVLAGWWSARRAPGHVAAIVWCAVGALVALGLSEALVPVLAQPRPYQVLHHVELLVPRAAAHSYALPNGHAAIAAAIVCGLVLARRWRLATAALLATLLLLVGCVYVGASYPSDVAVGAGLGAAVEVALWPLGSWLLGPVVASVAEGPFEWLVASSAPGRKPTRASVVQRPSTRMPNARAMDALRTATEAARHTPSVPPRSATSSIRTTVIRTDGRPPGSGPDEPRD